MASMNMNRLKYSVVPRMKKKLKPNKENLKYRIAAIAFTKKGNFIDIRYNNFREGLSNRKGAGLHAEQDLIHRYGNRIDTIYILRVGGSGDCLPIHPCEVCKSIADKRGIKIIPLHEELNLISSDYVYCN
jgi:hypothetical protein